MQVCLSILWSNTLRLSNAWWVLVRLFQALPWLDLFSKDSISPLRNDNVHYVYQRLEGRGPFHSPGDFEDFVAMLFHSQRRQYPLNLSTHGPSVPARSTGESQPDQPCHRTHEPPRHTLVPKTPVSSLQPSPIGRDDISASVKACPLNHTLYSQHPPVCLG